MSKLCPLCSKIILELLEAGQETVAPSNIAVAPKQKELTPIQKIIRAYKIAHNIDANDRVWDKSFFARHTRSAKDLLQAFGGNHDKAIIYMLGKGKEWNDSGFSDWGMEAVIRAAGKDYSKMVIENDNNADTTTERNSQGLCDSRPAGQVGADRVLERRGPTRIAHSGTIAGEVLGDISPNGASVSGAAQGNNHESDDD